jgi:hypothetical protein
MEKIRQMSFYGKTSDMFHAIFTDDSGNNFTINDYPPKFLGNDGISMSINLETGQILTWKPPTQEELLDYIEK